jgi:hypothetical protein
VDTVSHELTGVTLAGLAHADPAVSADPALSRQFLRDACSVPTLPILTELPV